jgi:hypothetical protein
MSGPRFPLLDAELKCRLLPGAHLPRACHAPGGISRWSAGPNSTQSDNVANVRCHVDVLL